MPEKITPEDLLNNIVGTFAESSSKQKSVPLFGEETSNSVTSKLNRLFGRQKPVYHLLGGGKSADVLLWRNKKISASVLTGATFIWVLFEWLNYHLLTLVGFALVPSEVPRLVLPDKLFVNIAISIGHEINRALEFIQDVALGGNLKQFLMYVVASLWVAAVIGSWCNFLTVLYIGFVAAHTLPVLYERYEDQVDNFAYQVLGQLQHNYQKLDTSVLSRIPKGKVNWKKHD
ncbi:reticulon-like protein B8 isoform X1 [Prunus yedoensis var. nudiflora]|uniref:Reticulon-like protein n=1 Tax=Prunus yedoensis var. nudiflora TaxID=2094558 RepID=A0A314YNX3_PRUYE|nr:reticulon-like protein B8 isoform X1 [Prunus yedoensis var. nudiflora]